MIDNVSFHKVTGVEEAIQAARATLRYLPQYSPEFNPIELVFHPLKAWLRCGAHNRRAAATCRVVHSSARPFRMYGVFQACRL